MQSPTTIKEVQRLTGRLAALSRFLPAAATRSYHFFKTIKRSEKFTWTTDCEKAFSEFKQILASPPILQKPEQETENEQHPVYFVSRVLQDAELRYPTIKKLAFGLVVTARCGAGILLKDDEGVQAERSIKFLFQATNNQAEYEALLAGLRLAKEVGISFLTVHCDSLLVVQQEEEDWRNIFINYMRNGEIPEGETPRSFRYKAAQYTLLEAELYKRGISIPLLKCLGPAEAETSLNELHGGICENHTGSRSLVTRTLRAGYYWPTMKKDCNNKVQCCDACQRCAPLIHNPTELLHTSNISWPFHKWGMDILGPFPISTGQVKFLLVAIDYFTKWVEAQPFAKITAEKVQNFIWKSIICRFSLPREIMSDNGRQFTNRKIASYLTDIHIKHHFSSVEHPQTNGLAEAANKVILQALKKKLTDAKGDELSSYQK
ncbi:uncharacterized protein [Arachis hypogaea]|uniref:uncharacterized protein n=1 Tax=Arachis hypogaea TaxID=3818 RepID=UPI003B21EB04